MEKEDKKQPKRPGRPRKKFNKGEYKKIIRKVSMSKPKLSPKILRERADIDQEESEQTINLFTKNLNRVIMSKRITDRVFTSKVEAKLIEAFKTSKSNYFETIAISIPALQADYYIKGAVLDFIQDNANYFERSYDKISDPKEIIKMAEILKINAETQFGCFNNGVWN